MQFSCTYGMPAQPSIRFTYLHSPTPSHRCLFLSASTVDPSSRLVQQKERDRELTFQPNLATTKYYKGGCCGRRNVRGEAAESSVVSQDYGGGETGGDCERAPQGAVRELQRFEMLYEDVGDTMPIIVATSSSHLLPNIF